MKRLIIVLMSFLTVSGYAQFSLHGDLRLRAEYRNGYRRMPYANDTPAGLVAQRTRLIMGFAQDRITTRISFQDSRIWGQQPPSADISTLSLHEAWLRIEFGDNWFAKAGRQEIFYDNQRFFATNDWTPTGLKHDALLFGFSNSNQELHIGTAFNQSFDRTFGTPYYLNNYKTLNYLWYRTSLTPALRLSLLGVADGYEHPENPRLLYMRATASAYLEYTPGGIFSFRINPAIQGGRAAWGQQIRAWYLMAEIGMKPSPLWHPLLGFESYSGNDYTELDDKYRAFHALYGAGHTAHGYMDYFVNVIGTTKGAGLVNPYLKNSFLLSDQLKLDADLHLFYLQNNLPPSSNDPVDKHLGTEVDLTLIWQFMPAATLSFGYSTMFGTESLEQIHGGSKDEFAHWAFVMLRYRPRLF